MSSRLDADLRKASNFLKEHKTLMFLLFCLILSAAFNLNQRLTSMKFGLIDPSFNFGVNAAAAAKMSFGTQFIATYGPLGFLVSNYLPKFMLEVNIWQMFYTLSLGFGVFLFIRTYKVKNIWLSALIIIYTLSILGSIGFIEWGYLCTFLLYCFVYLKANLNIKLLLTIILSSVAVIFALTKFTLGAGGISSLFLLIILSKISWKKKIKQVLYSAFTFSVLFFALSHELGVKNPMNYIKTAIIMTSGFSQSMSLYNTQTLLATIGVFFALLLIILWIIKDEKKSTLEYAFLLPSLFLVWKYCIVRQDVHILAVLEFTLPLTALVYYSRKTISRFNTKVALVIVVLSCFSVYANNIMFYQYTGFIETLTSPILNVIKGQPFAFFNVSQEKQNWASYSALGLQHAALPKNMTTLIGSNTIDIYPWEADVAAANGLKWDPRPSPYSFESYNPYFDNLNASFYKSNNAPKFIIWHNTSIYSIDGRYILWDEPKTIRAVLENYKLALNNNSFMLLERRQKPISVSFDRYYLGNVSILYKYYSLKTPKENQIGITYFTPQIGFAEFLKTELLRQDQFYLTLKYENDSKRTYRFVTSNASQGFITGGMPTNWKSLVSFFDTGKADKPSEIATSFEITKSP
ncbi:MAG: hypothetical protein ACYCPS_01640 [Candidatus Saccharimonadales bacterium]